jgi:hypothetical protein
MGRCNECVPCEDVGRANRLARFGEPFNWEGSMVTVAQWDIILSAAVVIIAKGISAILIVSVVEVSVIGQAKTEEIK